MKKKVLIIVALTFLFMFPHNTKAVCSDSEIVRLSNLAKNVKYSYIYDEQTKKIKIIFTNLTDELILKDTFLDKQYNTNTELILDKYSGTNRFNIYAKDKTCISDVLVTRIIEIPYYNDYYLYPECEGIENYSYCHKWIDKNISYEVWKDKTTNYKNTLKEEKIENNKKNSKSLSDLIINLYIDYYFIILPIIIILLSSVIYIKNKKESLF